VFVTKISDTDLRQIVSLYEMSERGAQKDADVHIRNEAINAVTVLFRLLGKYGLSLSDIPELQRQHAAKASSKATASATASAAQSADPNVLDLTQHMLQAYIAVQPHEYVGVTLWILHTHVFAKFQITPRLALLSPVRGCGKSKLLLFLEKLTANPERHDNVSAASLFRIIENHAGPTLLLDEGDNLGLRPCAASLIPDISWADRSHALSVTSQRRSRRLRRRRSARSGHCPCPCCIEVSLASAGLDRTA
jgi:hypothetical protein